MSETLVIPQLFEKIFASEPIGNHFVHQLTGICGYSAEDCKEKVNKHYQKIIDKHLQFTHVLKFPQ